jgi:glycosyltransferase involved in cell wall biosynthesis
MDSIRRPRVVIVGHTYLAEENRKSIDHLARRFEIEVISPAVWQDMIHEYSPEERLIEGEGWRMRLYPRIVPPGISPAAYLLRSFTMGMRRFKPEIVHIEGDPFVPFFIQSWLTSRVWARGARIVSTVKQNTYTSRGKIADAVKDTLARRFQSVVDRFVVVNQGVARIYQDRFGVEPQRMSHITHLGVDTRLFSPQPDEQNTADAQFAGLDRGDLLVGYVGRLSEDKGIDDLLEAMTIARTRTGKNLRLALLGAGPMHDGLIERSGQCDWLSVVAPVPHKEVPGFLRRLDMFVMPSRVLEFHIEHDGHAVMEAMACARASIGSSSGANPEVIGECGLTVKDADSKALAAAICSLAENAERRRELGDRARERVLQEYSLEAVARKYGEVYDSVLDL